MHLYMSFVLVQHILLACVLFPWKNWDLVITCAAHHNRQHSYVLWGYFTNAKSVSSVAL